MLQDFPGHVVRAYCHEPRAPSTLAAQVQTTRAAAACSTRCGAWPEQTVDVPPSPCDCASSRTLRAGTRPPSQPCRVSERSEERRSGCRGQHAGFARPVRAAPLVCRLPSPAHKAEAGTAGAATPAWLARRHLRGLSFDRVGQASGGWSTADFDLPSRGTLLVERARNGKQCTLPVTSRGSL